MKITKRGQSTNLVLIVGIILTTAISIFAVYSTFDDIVNDMVLGDPDVAAREIASYMDIAAASPNEITIYTRTPITVAGFPAYGTVLLNAKDQEIRVHPYMQNLMQSQILKTVYGEISVEEVATLVALYDMRNTDVVLNAQRGLAAKVSADILEDASDGIIQAVDDKGATRYKAKAGGCCGGKYKGGQFVSHVDVDNIVSSKRASGASLAGRRDILKRTSTKIADKKIARAAAVVKFEKAGFIGKQWKRMTRVAGLIRPANLVNLFTHAGSKVWNKEVVKKMRKPVVKAAKKMGVRIVLWSGTTKIFKSTMAVEKGDWTGITAVVRRVVYAGLTVGEGFLVFWPIHRAIVNSQDATQQLEDKFGTFKFHTGNTEIHVAKPNCHSERYAINADVNMPFVGVLGLDAVLGRQFNMPMSRKLDEKPRKYEKITNDGEECYDAHNVYLNQDGEIIRDIPLIGAPLANHPYATTVGVPFAACLTMGFVEPSWGSGCIMGMEAAILGAWANSENFYTEGLPYDSWGGNLFMGGVAAAVGYYGSPVSMGALALYLTLPADSSTIFTFISDSGRLIDSDVEYYMNDPYLISISKKYDEDKDKYILVIDKEI